MATVKAIVFYEESDYSRYAYLAENVGDLPNADKTKSRWLCPIFN